MSNSPDPTHLSNINAAFEALALSAGVPDIPPQPTPLVASDVMQARGTGTRSTAEVWSWTSVCGYYEALAEIGQEWHRLIVLEVVLLGELVKDAVSDGPAGVVMTTWSREPLNGEPVVSFTVETWDEPDGVRRRFGVRVPQCIETTDLATADVFALRFVEDDGAADFVGSDCDGEFELSWIIKNDPSMWRRDEGLTL